MTIEKLDTSTPDLTRQNIERLLELFPECRTEGSREDAASVDFDLLRQALSDYLVEGPAERYRLDWPGKRQALLTANTPIEKTLRPMRPGLSRQRPGRMRTMPARPAFPRRFCFAIRR